jgi:WD40 repeat protein
VRAPRGWSGWLLGACVLGLAVAGTVDAVRGGEAEPPAAGASASPRGEELRGPLVPAPGVLGGSLTVVVDAGCRVRTLDLATVILRAAGTASCDLWAAPGGGLAVVSAARQGSRFELWLAQLGESPSLILRLGPARGEPSWSSDGTLVAWCSLRGVTLVLDLRDDSEREVPGCSPRFAPDGSLLTLPDRPVSSAVLRDGRPVLRAADLARGFGDSRPARVDVLDVDQDTGGRLAVSVASVGVGARRIVLELWRDGRLVGTRPLPARVVPGVGALGELLRFSPTGAELAIGFARPAFGLMILDLRSDRVVREESPARGFAWSPDGRWLAVATRQEIVIAGAVRTETAYVLPLTADALAWS